MEKIAFNHLSFSYEGQQVLTDLNADFAPGKIHLLTGKSGSGKSTILKLLAGLLPKYGGQITAGSIKLTVNGRTGMLFQDPLMQFALDTPRHELEFTLENCQTPIADIPARLNAALEFGQVTNLADRLITTLSGGQQQRVALAVIMAMKPRLILLDEPFANVDEQSRLLILAQLQAINQQTGATIIIADHDLHGYQPLHPQVWRLAHQQLTELAPAAAKQLLTNMSLPRIQASVPPASASSSIDLRQLTIQRGASTILPATTCQIIAGKVTLLTGPNGVGKSTLLKAIARLVKYQGQIFYRQSDIQQLSPGKYYQQLGLVFQHANDQFLNVTVGEELALSTKNGRNPYFTPARIQEALTKLDLAGRDDQVIYSLSGGQKKKLQLLLMLMMGQETLLLDEPFTGLDGHSLATVLKLINASRQVHPQTLVIVSHQLAGLQGFVDYHLQMSARGLRYLGGNKHES